MARSTKTNIRPRYLLDRSDHALFPLQEILHRPKGHWPTRGGHRNHAGQVKIRQVSSDAVVREIGHFNVEGVDNVNACYGGTNAVFNSLNWVESSAWDGRDAVVVAGDIALYKKGNARPTGGAGCVAMVIGPDAPLVFEPGKRGSYITHAYDFYKPDLTSEYPYVDGQFSLKCYTEAVDACYKAYNAREEALKPKMNGSAVNGNGVHHVEDSKTPIDRFDYMAFHAPTCKLVSKSYASYVVQRLPG